MSALMFGESRSVMLLAVLAACCLPYSFAVIAKTLGGFRLKDNEHPRLFLQNLTGAAARANAAQQNSFESLPIFIAAVLFATYFFVPQNAINVLACMYVIIRVLYGIAYIANLAMFRTVLWTLSFVCCVMLFYFSMRVMG